MSDSQPPYGGPDPDDGWDLEGLLSGDSVWLPDGMRPVAAALSALRGAPMRSELAAEASARAEFRRAVLASQGGPPAPSAQPAPSAPSAPLVQPAQQAPLVQPAPAAQPAPLVQASNGHTLILPAQPAGGPPPARPRHSHRRPPRRGRWQPKALAGVAAGAAVLVVVGGIALAGGFSGVAPQPGQAGRSSTAAGAATSAGRASAGPGLEGSATKVPTAHPTHSASGQQSSSPRSTLCRQYWAFFARPESSAGWDAEKASLRQLSDMASSPWNISRYCMPYYQWGFAPPAAGSGPGNGQGGPGSQGPAGSLGGNQVAPQPGDQNDGNGDAGKKNADKEAGNGKSQHGKGNGAGNDNQQ